METGQTLGNVKRPHIVVGVREKIELEVLKELIGKKLAKRYGASRASESLVIRFLLDELYKHNPELKNAVELVIKTRNEFEVH